MEDLLLQIFNKISIKLLLQTLDKSHYSMKMGFHFFFFFFFFSITGLEKNALPQEKNP